MLRTLKIAKFLAAVAAVCFIAYLTVSGMKPDEDTEAILAKPSAVSKFRKLSVLLNRAKDKESEFVKQAKKFARRINPPRPVVTPKPGTRLPTNVTTVAEPIIPDIPKIPPTKKFTLVGTCRYPEQPDKSLAQLNIIAEGKKWVRQGDVVGHLTIHEVKDGSIVLYQGGTMHGEMSVPQPKKTKSLLKSTEDTETIVRPEKIVKHLTARTPRPRVPKRVAPKRVAPKPVVTKPVTTKPVAAKPVTPKPEPVPPKPPTPEELKEALDESIAEIQKIIKENMSSSKDGGGGADQKMLEGLIQMLEEDKKKIDSESSAKDPQGRKSEPAKKALKSSKTKKPANTKK
jgi:hypothetical protein